MNNPSVEIKANQLFTRDFVFVCIVVFLLRLSEESISVITATTHKMSVV